MEPFKKTFLTFFIFQATELSYISGNRERKNLIFQLSKLKNLNISYILGNGTL